jgi:CRP-like cAMP-binding protein
MAERLDKTHWSRDFSWAEIQSLSEHLAAVRVPMGQYIVQENQEERFMAILLGGKASVVKRATGRAQKDLAELRVGYGVGELALLDGHPRSASVVAKSDCRLLVLTLAHLQFMEVEKPELCCKLLKRMATTLAQRLRTTSATLVDIMVELAPG